MYTRVFQWIAAGAACAVAIGCGEVTSPVGDAAPNGQNGGDGDGGDTDVGDGGPSGPDAAPADPCSGDEIEFADLMDCLVEAQCEAMVECQGVYASREECLAYHGDLSFRGLEATFEMYYASDVIEYSGENAAECLAGMRAMACDFSGAEAVACEQIFIGLVEEGDTCFDREECAGPGSRCRESNGCEPGEACCERVCERAAAVGESCEERSCQPETRCVSGTCEDGAVGSACERDSHCDGWCFEGSCTSPLARGQTCERDSQCEGTDVCIEDAEEQPVCQPIDEEGAACEGFCVGPLYCDQSGDEPGACTPLPREVDEDCSDANRCLGVFLGCDDDTQVCVPVPGEGDVCAGPCEPGLICSAEVDEEEEGICEPPRAEGEPCRFDPHCASGDCQQNADGDRFCQPIIDCRA